MLASAPAGPAAARRRWLAFGLVLALLAMQTVGALHRLAHPVPAAAHGGASVAATLGPADAAHGEDRLDRLFSGHGGEHDCDAFDHATHGDLALGTLADASHLLPGSAQQLRHPAWHLATQARGALARGPPRTA